MPSTYVPHRCIVIADDLTGACDSGLEYARAGLRTRITFDIVDALEADVLVLSTDSRRMSPQAAFKHVRELASLLPLDRAVVVFKKIDSTLRGNIFQECEAVRQVADARVALLAPALPAQGRIVENGILKVADLAGGWSLDVEQKLREQGARVERVQLDALAQRIAEATSLSPYFLCDATSDEDLASIATVLWKATQRTIWIGSAGLAKPLATLLTKDLTVFNAEQGAPYPRMPKPVLACIGSDHPVTTRQMEYLRQNRTCSAFKVASVEASEIVAAFAQNRHILLVLDMQQPNEAPLRRFFEELPIVSMGGIFISGGDTAALVCRAADVRELWLSGQIQNGVAYGYIEGGALGGLAVATKSGGFGKADDLARAIDFLSTAPSCEREPLT
jgi:D-threonate/D-erythronate kinase